MWKALFYVVCLTWIPAGTSGAQADLTKDPALVIHYSFDDFTTVVPDLSGKGHNGSVQGNLTPASDQGHRAGQFLGTKAPVGFSYCDLDGANFPPEDIPTSAMTLAAWVKCENNGGHHAILNARASDATWVFHPEIRSENNFRWLARAYGSTMLFDIRAGTVAWGEWTHYVGTYDKATGKAILYINKQKVNETTVAAPQDIAGDWRSGARVGINVDNARPLTGFMDELYLFKRALASTELEEVSRLPRQLKAFAPDPPDGTKNLTTPLFRWSAGETAVLHDVYIGTSRDLGPVDLVGKRLAAMVYWHAPGFEAGRTYYWRVDEIEADGVTVHTGDVWSFAIPSKKAGAPKPRDGTKWVAVAPELSWTAGVGAISHDVYFGTDKAAVEAGTGGTAKGNQFLMSFAPGKLAENTTYYWRVDEHAGDVLHQGDVWSFTTIGPGVGVKAQYFRGVEPAGAPVLTTVENSVDHNWGAADVAPGLADNVSARWTANLEAPFTETFELITTSDDGCRLWLDGRLLIDSWRSHGSTDDLVKVPLVAGQVYLLQMDWWEGSGNGIARLWWQSPSITRQIIPAGPLQLPVRATGPYPANTAVNVIQTPLLQWMAGEKAAQHDLYFGDSAEAVLNATTATANLYRGRQALKATTFDPGPLEWNKTYYWRVDEVNTVTPDSPWRGSLWSFTTANFVVVDDFESYTDAEGSRIYDAWLDNYDPTGDGSGSVVGNDVAPFAEQKIVHGGRQSLPMTFNNAGPKYLFSEIVRTFDPPQDWTVNGVKVLTLSVRGVTTNKAEPFYVAVEDKAGKVTVVTNPDAALLTKEQWTEWKIPLTDFAGVNAAAVKKMYIGVGSRTAPKTGGAGALYLDDIRVVKP